MNKSFGTKRLLKVVGTPLVVILVLYLVWDGLNGWGVSEIITGIGLVLVVGAMLYIRQMDNISEMAVSEKIRQEYPPESQPQVFEIYQRMKIKELEGLFLKILDDAHGNLNEVKKLASLAESVGWKAFIENRW
jgi:hypothetical protein